MKKLFIILFFAPFLCASQVIVNDVDINKEVNTFELWAFKQAFSTKESFFINYGQDRFKPHYYDHKTQCVRNAENNKFEKGKFLQLNNYLESQGWIKKDERNESIGNIQGRVITYVKNE